MSREFEVLNTVLQSENTTFPWTEYPVEDDRQNEHGWIRLFDKADRVLIFLSGSLQNDFSQKIICATSNYLFYK